MTALIYEIVWIRPLSTVFGTTIYAASIIIASFLLGIALGSWIAGRYSDRISNHLKFYAFIELGIGFYGLLLIPLFPALPELYLDIYKTTFPNYSLFSLLQFFLAFSIILIPTTLMGATLPLVLKAYSSRFVKMGHDIGKLYSTNNIGAVVGTLAAGFILIPLFGIKNTIWITAIINISLALTILVFIRIASKKIIVIAAISILLLCLALFSTYDYHLMGFGMFFYAYPALDMNTVHAFLSKENVRFYQESQYSTVAVTSFDGIDVLAINGKTQCSTKQESIDSMNRLAFLPFTLFEYNYGRPHNALNIGLGCGTTSEWLSNKTSTTTLEIDPVIVKASSLFISGINQTLIIDDARNWLVRNDEKFDIIVTQPTDPFANRGNLFSYEFFSLISSRLTDDGLASVWVPVYLMNMDDFYVFYNTFHAVFPHVYIYEKSGESREMIFIGSKMPLTKGNQLYQLSDKDIVYKKTDLDTDDRPLLEFSSAKNIYRPNTTEIFNKIGEWKNNSRLN